MLRLVVLLLGVAAVCRGRDIPGVKTTEKYAQAEILDSDENYILFWNYNDTHVTFETHVKTKGWVGFGLSTNGDMYPADVVIGWVSDDGSAHLSDRHTVGHSPPVTDKSQDWYLLYGEENEFGTVLKFVRAINTCDDAGDQVIQDGTTRAIFAYGTSDPAAGGVITYHGQSRGTKSLALLSAVHVPSSMPSDVKHYDFLNMNHIMPTAATSYWCHAFQMPDIGGKHHMIKYEAVVTPGNELNVHHILLYRCKGIDPASDGIQGDCYQSRPANLPHCSNIILAWAIGGKPFYFPDHVGFSVGASDDPSFYIMETHYDNPTLRAGAIDDSGIRMTLTPTLRPQEAGLLEIGVQVNEYQVIPPYQKAFVSKGYCAESCIREGMAAGHVSELKVFSALQHSHLLGVAMTTRHFRNGAELEPLITDPHYDFDFQENRVLPKERSVYPGDSFRLDCTYDSRKRSHVTLGGLSTQDEMCLTFAYYYPRIPAASCASQVMYDNFHIQRNQMYQYIMSADWTNKTVSANFQQMAHQSKIRHACRGDGFTGSTHVFAEKDDQTPYVPPPPVCS